MGIKVRDMALLSGLGVKRDCDQDEAFVPETKVFTSQSIEMLEKKGTNSNNIIDALSPVTHARVNMKEKIYKEGDRIVMNSNSLLADIQLEMDVDQSLILSLVNENVALARLTSSSTSFQLE